MDVLDDLITTFEDDFNKYRKRVPAARLTDVNPRRCKAPSIALVFLCTIRRVDL